MRGVTLAALPLLALAACATDPAPVVVTPRVVCPSFLTAEPEPQPDQPALTDAQQLAIDAAAIRAVGLDPVSADAQARIARDGWGVRGWARVTVARQWCLDRQAQGVTDK